MLGRVGALERQRPSGVGVHRTDVDLVAVPARRRGAVIADGERQEVEHEVRVGDVLVRTGEATALEVVRRPWAATEEQPLEADPRPAPLLGRRRLHRHRLGAGVLDVHLEVVLEVLTDAGEVGHDRDAERAQVVRRADPGEHQQLRGVDRPAGKDHVTGEDPIRRPSSARPRATSTPMARDPSNSTRLTNAPVRTMRFGRPMTGCR